MDWVCGCLHTRRNHYSPSLPPLLRPHLGALVRVVRRAGRLTRDTGHHLMAEDTALLVCLSLSSYCHPYSSVSSLFNTPSFPSSFSFVFCPQEDFNSSNMTNFLAKQHLYSYSKIQEFDPGLDKIFYFLLLLFDPPYYSPLCSEERHWTPFKFLLQLLLLPPIFVSTCSQVPPDFAQIWTFDDNFVFSRRLRP